MVPDSPCMSAAVLFLDIVGVTQSWVYCGSSIRGVSVIFLGVLDDLAPWICAVGLAHLPPLRSGRLDEQCQSRGSCTGGEPLIADARDAAAAARIGPPGLSAEWLALRAASRSWEALGDSICALGGPHYLCALSFTRRCCRPIHDMIIASAADLLLECQDMLLLSPRPRTPEEAKEHVMQSFYRHTLFHLMGEAFR